MKSKLFLALSVLLMAGTAAFAQTSFSTIFENDSYIAMEKNAKALIIESDPAESLPKIIVNNEGAFVLTHTHHELTQNTEEMFAADESVIYPGSLLWINRSLADGEPDPCAFKGAPGKVRLTITLNLGSSSRTSFEDVTNDYAHVHQQILDWLTSFGTRVAGMDEDGTTEYFSSKSHMAASLKVNADFLGSRLGVSMNTSSDEFKVVSVQNFTHKFYTVYASVIDNDPATILGGASPTAVQNAIKSHNCPIGFVSSVSYGRRAYRFHEFTSKDFTFNGDESVSVTVGANSGSASSTQNVTNSQKCSRFWAFVQSGFEGDTEIFKSTQASESSGSEFMKAVTRQSKLTPENPGVVLNYTVKTLVSQKTVKKSFTDSYYETTYTACPHSLSVEIHKEADQVGGSSIQYKLNYKVIHVFKDLNGKWDYEIWSKPRTSGARDADPGYVDYVRNNFSMGETRANKTIPTKDCPDKENCYIYELWYSLDGNHASGQRWSHWDEGYIPLTSIKNNKVRIYINGSNYARKKPYIHSKSTGR
jgi:hypothetical protein